MKALTVQTGRTLDQAMGMSPAERAELRARVERLAGMGGGR